MAELKMRRLLRNRYKIKTQLLAEMEYHLCVTQKLKTIKILRLMHGKTKTISHN